MPPEASFVEPPWLAPLDAERAIALIPAEARIAGMFYLGLIAGARKKSAALELPSDRYLPFSFYSLADFARALVRASSLFYPSASLRQGLRRLGHGGPKVFAASTLGKVTLGSGEGVHAAVNAIAKTYEINIRPCHCRVLSSAPSSMIVRLSDVHHFLDSHHVGVFEGTLEHAGVRGSVRVSSRSRTEAEFLLNWA